MKKKTYPRYFVFDKSIFSEGMRYRVVRKDGRVYNMPVPPKNGHYYYRSKYSEEDLESKLGMREVTAAELALMDFT